MNRRERRAAAAGRWQLRDALEEIIYEVVVLDYGVRIAGRVRTWFQSILDWWAQGGLCFHTHHELGKKCGVTKRRSMFIKRLVEAYEYLLTVVQRFMRCAGKKKKPAEDHPPNCTCGRDQERLNRRSNDYVINPDAILRCGRERLGAERVRVLLAIAKAEATEHHGRDEMMDAAAVETPAPSGLEPEEDRLAPADVASLLSFLGSNPVLKVLASDAEARVLLKLGKKSGKSLETIVRDLLDFASMSRPGVMAEKAVWQGAASFVRAVRSEKVPQRGGSEASGAAQTKVRREELEPIPDRPMSREAQVAAAREAAAALESSSTNALRPRAPP